MCEKKRLPSSPRFEGIAAFVVLMCFAGSPALATPTTVNVLDPTTSTAQIVDSNGNAAVTPQAATTGGSSNRCSNNIAVMSPAKIVSCGSSAAHQVYVYQLNNSNNNVPVYFQIFDATSVTWGTTVPIEEIAVPAGGNDIISIPVGDSFSNGIMFACTTTPTGSTAPADICAYTFWYQ